MAGGWGNALRNQDSGVPTGGRPQGEIMSISEAGEFLSVHRNTLYKLIQEGDIPAFRLTTGGRWKFKRSDLERWLEDRQAQRTR